MTLGTSETVHFKNSNKDGFDIGRQYSLGIVHQFHKSILLKNRRPINIQDLQLSYYNVFKSTKVFLWH